MRKLKRSFVIIAAIAVMCALIYAIFLSPMPFDSERWRADVGRWRMEQDLANHIIGLTMDEVIDLLGECDFGTRHDRFAYSIGGPPRPFRYIEVTPFNTWCVVIIFDRNSGVAVEVIFTNRIQSWMGG